MSEASIFVRVRMNAVTLHEDEEPMDHQVTVDMVIARDSCRVVGKHMLFGIYGAPLREAMCPFMLHKDGKVDFGNMGEARDRFEHFNLREKEIRVGELATWDGEFESWQLKIVAVQEVEELGKG